jgi:hypothetical protein
VHRPLALLVWCGADAPVVQGLLVGLGVAAVGVALFPFDLRLVRPRSGRLSGFARAGRVVRWARAFSAALAVLTPLTLAGYVGLFVSTGGAFCDARLNAAQADLVLVWAVTAAVTFLVLAVAAGLRRAARRAQQDAGG